MVHLCEQENPACPFINEQTLLRQHGASRGQARLSGGASANTFTGQEGPPPPLTTHCPLVLLQFSAHLQSAGVTSISVAAVSCPLG